ncbi:hypothetical protein LB553_21190 [Mesorhizobium sp. CA8]|uniref:hypothetical protein n=1 Tax=Mesorhizobium sp. CA8 TaxID=2876637 RepID=UPI001CCF2892|nr:hypothetical protein [Mesorhizobium sp. CA8]MBZ9763378.1 hypothetical protein [Mesorhizobium sp. CA8]
MGKAEHERIDFDFKPDYDKHTTYREAPFHLREPFRAFVRESYEPEYFPGLYWGRLHKHEPFEVIEEFAVDRKKRQNGDYIPCPMCAHKEKFLEGALVYIFARQAIAIIGNECAAEDQKRAAWDKWKADRKRAHEEDCLLYWLQRIPFTVANIASLLPVAKEIDKAHRDFNRGAPTIQKALRRSSKDGVLMLAESVDNVAARYDDRLPKRVTRNHIIGALRGAAMVRPNSKFARDLSLTKDLFAGLDDCRTAEDALERTVEIVAAGDGSRAVQRVVAALHTLQKLTEDISDARTFFSQDNIDTIRAWGSHRAQPAAFSVERHVSRAGLVITFARPGKDDQGEYCRLGLSNESVDWAPDDYLWDLESYFSLRESWQFRRRRRK